jgi:hypothetical protein
VCASKWEFSKRTNEKTSFKQYDKVKEIILKRIHHDITFLIKSYSLNKIESLEKKPLEKIIPLKLNTLINMTRKIVALSTPEESCR